MNQNLARWQAVRLVVNWEQRWEFLAGWEQGGTNGRKHERMGGKQGGERQSRKEMEHQQRRPCVYASSLVRAVRAGSSMRIRLIGRIQAISPYHRTCQ